MRLPLSWLKDFIDYGTRSPQELAEVFTLLGHEVEKIEDPARSLEKIYVGQVLRIDKHPNADKLRIAQTRLGSKVYKIICGGSNLREGMFVALAMPGARVRWHGTGDLVELKETEIRGVKSAGMICASAEIGLESLFPAKDEKEVIDLSNLSKRNFDKKGSFVSGESLESALGLEPVLHLDITPNRADCLSVMGLARELAAGLGKRIPSFSPHRWSSGGRNKAGVGSASSFKLHVSSPNLCPKYTAQVFTNVKVGESPSWIKTRLWQAGVRPINNIVDATNYVMIETGEPMHAFDLDNLSKSKIRNPKSEIRDSVKIIIRNAEQGEKIKALDGNTYELDETMLVIADSKKPVAIAGVMGGEETGITVETKNILLEAAIFDPVSVRKTSRKLGLRSESSSRFEKGIAWPLPELAQDHFSVILRAKPEKSHTVVAVTQKPLLISQTTEAINQMLNLELRPVRIKKNLTSLGFKYLEVKPRELTRFHLVKFRVQVPWWRLDIKTPEDLYEEVGRIYGLNKLTPTLPQGELKLAPRNHGRELAQAARDVLLGLGFDEVLTYSFYGREVLEKDGSLLEREPHMQVANPINPSQELLRTNLTRNLLDVVSRNARIFDEVKIFEIGKVFHPPPKFSPSLRGRTEGEVVHEENHLAIVYTMKGTSEEEIFRKLKGDVQALIGKQKKVEFREAKDGLDIYFAERSEAQHQRVSFGAGVGWLGLLNESRKIAWKIKEPCALAEFNLDAVLTSGMHPLKYQPIPEFPPVRRDIAFVVDEKINYGEIAEALQGIDELICNIELFDIFRNPSIGADKKSLALHITLQSPEKTLSDEEANAVVNKLTKLFREKFNANVRE